MTSEPRPHRVTRTRSVVWRLVALLSAVVVTLLLAEVALRLAWSNPYSQVGRRRFVELRVQAPGVDTVINRQVVDPDSPQVRFRTDHRSFVLPARQFEKPVATIAFLGGSTTECLAVAEPLRFPALVSVLLKDRGYQVNTFNAARSGNTLQDSLNLVVNHLIDEPPTFVVVMNVANDIGVLQARGDYATRLPRELGLGDYAESTVHMASGRSWVVGLIRHAVSGTVLKIRPPAELASRNDPGRRPQSVAAYSRRLRSFVGAVRGIGSQPVLMTEPLAGARNEITPDWANSGAQDAFNQIIRDVASDEGVLLIDLAHHISKLPNWDQLGALLYDGMHVNDRGSRAYADHIVQRLEPIIRDNRPSREP